jgi:chorismate mutase
VTTEEIAEIKRRSAQYKRRFTSEQVAAHFRVLQEAVERDQLTPDQVVQLLRRLQDETPA